MNEKIQKIKALLKAKNLTYEQFAKLIGKSKPTVVNWFKGASKIDIDTIEKIAQVLGVPVSYFFGESGGVPEGGARSSGDCSELRARLEGCQEKVRLLEQRIQDKDELIKLLKEQMKK